MDLVVRGGTVVTASSHAVTDIGIEGGRIVQLGGPMQAPVEIDARGRPVLPGGIDLHVHLTPAGSSPHAWRWVDDFDRGTAAALLGGITTVGNMTHPDRGESMVAAVARDSADGEAHARCDFVLHPILMDPSASELASIDDLAAAGHTSLKIFLSFRRFERSVDGYLDALRRVARVGGLAMVHCEDVAVIDCCCRILRDEGRTDPRHYPEGRPVAAERAATERAVAFSEITGAADLRRPPLLGRRARRLPGGPGPGPAGLRRDPTAVPAPHPGALRGGRGRPLRRARRRCATPPTSTPCGRPSRRARSPRWPPTTPPGAWSRSSTPRSTPPTCARAWPSCRPRCRCCGGRGCGPGASRCGASWRSPPPTRPAWPACSRRRARSRSAATPIS